MSQFEEYDAPAPEGWEHGPIRMRRDLDTGETEVLTHGFNEWMNEQRRARRQREQDRMNNPPAWSLDQFGQIKTLRE